LIPLPTLFKLIVMIAAYITSSTCGHISPLYVLAPFSPATSLSSASNFSWLFDITIFLSPSHPPRLHPNPRTSNTSPLLTWILNLHPLSHATPFTHMHAYPGTHSSPSSPFHPHLGKASDNIAPIGPRALSLITPCIISDGICAIYFALREPHQRWFCYLWDCGWDLPLSFL